jgi:alginate O-acetyltransferase complex protein AlgI
MVFNTPVFLFIFLPITLILYLLAGRRLRNAVLMAASLLFYLWGEPLYFPLILVSIACNFYLGKWVELQREQPGTKRFALTLAIVFNLGMLVFFKLFNGYWMPLLDWMQNSLGLNLSPVVIGYVRKFVSFPLGISFFSFAMVAYAVDIAKKRTPAEANLLNFAQYVLLFPKIIAGPIVRYREVAGQLKERPLDVPSVAQGLRRFIIGLAKKILIADVLGAVVDGGVFDRALPGLPVWAAWLVLVCFTLQIFYDFSGYSDMAIGLGQVFGFRFPENFNYPYLARGVSDFWRRWHISLSNWFRDYLFYPLERWRHGAAGWQVVNILIVFLATGLWHGTTLNFIIWGLLHGMALVLENGRFGRWVKQAPGILVHGYTLAVVLVGWVFFRANSPTYALAFLGNLVGLGGSSAALPYSIFKPVQLHTWMALIAGVLLAFPTFAGAQNRLGEKQAAGWLRDAALLGLLLLSLVFLASSTYHPYIYGNF